MGSRLTVAFSKVEENGVFSSAAELLPLVHKGFLHSFVPAEDYHPPGAQVHCEHGAILLAQLGQKAELGRLPGLGPLSTRGRPLHLGEGGQQVLGAKLQQVSQEREGPGAGGQFPPAPGAVGQEETDESQEQEQHGRAHAVHGQAGRGPEGRAGERGAPLHSTALWKFPSPGPGNGGR